MDFQGLIIGIPKEIMTDERRVAAAPETVRKMSEKGARVLIEKGAGEGSFFSDDNYRDAGGEITDDVENLYRTSDIILKVKEPQFNNRKGNI